VQSSTLDWKLLVRAHGRLYNKMPMSAAHIMPLLCLLASHAFDVHALTGHQYVHVI